MFSPNIHHLKDEKANAILHALIGVVNDLNVTQINYRLNKEEHFTMTLRLLDDNFILMYSIHHKGNKSVVA